MKKYNEIFLAGVGTTPQILTECIYYYYHSYYGQNRYFDRIKVFTTNRGTKKLLDSLFKEKKINKLEQALQLPIGSLPFDKNDIILFSNKDGSPIEDLRTTEETDRAITILYSEIKRWSQDKNVRITATVAGGRKTMSAAMALAFQLYAREHDELIHIMAPDEKMDTSSKKAQNWFFPSDPTDPKQKLDVIQVPIIKVGRYLGHDLNISPEALAEELQKSIISDAPLEDLIIDKNSFSCIDETITIPANEAAYLRYFIKRRINSSCSNQCKGCAKCFVANDELLEAAQNEVLIEHELISGKYDGHFAKAKEARQKYFTVEPLNGHIASLDKKISQSKCSTNFKKQLRLKKIQAEPSDLRIKAKGILINSDVVTFNK